MPITNLNISIPPSKQQFATPGSGTYFFNQAFLLVSGTVTAGATYTNNGVTFTVTNTIAAGQILYAFGNGSPLSAGTLTKASGTGDAAINFFAVVTPKYLIVRVLGGGSSGGTVAADPAVGSASTFVGAGVSITANTGGSASTGIAPPGGTATGGDLNVTGGHGHPGNNNATTQAGNGGASPFGQGGGGGSAAGTSGLNSNVPGAGGGGGATSSNSRAGGAAGGYSEKLIQSPSIAGYSYTVGSGGSGVANAGNGGNGLITIEEHFGF